MTRKTSVNALDLGITSSRNNDKHVKCNHVALHHAPIHVDLANCTEDADTQGQAMCLPPWDIHNTIADILERGREEL